MAEIRFAVPASVSPLIPFTARETNARRIWSPSLSARYAAGQHVRPYFGRDLLLDF
jgi:hypothetical protein